MIFLAKTRSPQPLLLVKLIFEIIHIEDKFHNAVSTQPLHGYSNDYVWIMDLYLGIQYRDSLTEILIFLHIKVILS